MIIALNHIVPAPIAGTFVSGENCVWDAEIAFESPKNYLVNAESGKGKSTLLNIIYGIRTDFTGSFTVNGQQSSAMSLNEWATLRQTQLSVVFQDLKLFPNLTVLDNLLIKNRLTDYASEPDIRQMMEQLGIGNKAEQHCGTLSLGQQQRVAIIRSLLQPFKLILLDEPFSHIDTENQKIATGLINEHCSKNNAGLLLTTLGERYFFDYDKTVTV